MRNMITAAAITLVVFLSGCETMPNNQIETPTAGVAQQKEVKPTPQEAKDAGIDCNIVPRAKDEIAIYRQFCL